MIENHFIKTIKWTKQKIADNVDVVNRPRLVLNVTIPNLTKTKRCMILEYIPGRVIRTPMTDNTWKTCEVKNNDAL